MSNYSANEKPAADAMDLSWSTGIVFMSAMLQELAQRCLELRAEEEGKTTGELIAEGRRIHIMQGAGILVTLALAAAQMRMTKKGAIEVVRCCLETIEDDADLGPEDAPPQELLDLTLDLLASLKGVLAEAEREPAEP